MKRLKIEDPKPLLTPLVLSEPWMRRRVQIVEILIEQGFIPAFNDKLAGFEKHYKGNSEWLMRTRHRHMFGESEASKKIWKTRTAPEWRKKLIEQKETLFADQNFIFAELKPEEKALLYKRIMRLLDAELSPAKILKKKLKK